MTRTVTGTAGRRAWRWLLVLPCAVIVWYGAAFLGLALLALADAMCPPDLIFSGACIAPWHRFVTEAIFALCAGVAAAGIVVAPTLIAPAHRRIVARTVFTVGAGAAIGMGIILPAWLALTAALAAGTVALAVLERRL